MNILLARSGGLGDSILTLPVAVLLRQMYPGARLDVLGNGWMLDAARLSGLFDGYHSMENGAIHVLFSGCAVADGELRDYISRYHRIYFFSSAPEHDLDTALSAAGSPHRRILDPRPPAGWKRHITEHLTRIIEDNAEGIPLPVISLSAAGHAEKYGLVIHPSSGGALKNWPLDRFIEIADRMRLKTVFLLGPAELDRGFHEALSHAVYEIVTGVSLHHLAGILSDTALYLGNDSGVSHLAAACGARAFVLFGPSDPVVWRPLGDAVTLITSPDGAMESIETDMVYRTLAEAMWGVK